MTETTNEDLQQAEMHEEAENAPVMEESGIVKSDLPNENEPGAPSDNFREASYFVLFIAAVFVINAMETGSYRTPWPVAITVTLLGFGLLGYSFYKKSGSN